jgi:hypothetical protein
MKTDLVNSVQKPLMPEVDITETVPTEVTAKLAADHDRFRNSTVFLSITQATFQSPDGSEGRLYVSAGGNAVDVKFGERCWRINLSALAQAAWDADQAYLAKMKQR